MDSLISYTITGIFTGAAYAIAASGLVLTYSTTRVFNVAHGAFGMVLAFLYWDLSQRQGLALWLSMLIVLFLIAPVIGFLVQKFLTKGLGEGPVGVSLVVTVGLLVALIGVATQIWPPEARSVPKFFENTGGGGIHLGETRVSYHELLTILLSVVVAGGLYLLLNRTRVGIAMRASVDNPELLKLFGGRPELVSAMAWSIGISLAGLGGMLLAPTIGMEYYQLTLLVITAYAAAMLGKLKSLPLTFAGAMGLGLTNAYAVGYLPTGSPIWGLDPGGLKAVIPTLFLFAIIVLMPQAQLRVGQVKGIVSAPVPSLMKSALWGVLLVVAVAVMSLSFADSDLLLLGTGATFAIMMLSLVLLTGYGGHVSLAQFTFAGVGALAYAKLDMPNLIGLVLAGLIASGVGALVALPVLRLTGLYLALSTLAFAQLMDKLIFQADFAFKFNGILEVERMSILGIQVSDTGSYVVLMSVFFVVMAILLLMLRRGRLGRVLIAMRDSQAACGTLGLNMRWFRVGLFAASAGMAGVAGALFAGLRETVGASDFMFFNNFTLLLVAVVWGVTSVTGAAIGGMFLMYMPVVQSDHPEFAGLVLVVLGAGAVVIGRDPNGLANKLFNIGKLGDTGPVSGLKKRLPGRGNGKRRADEAEAEGHVHTSHESIEEAEHVSA
jgi:branched-chain amino acid transport system permease protein